MLGRVPYIHKLSRGIGEVAGRKAKSGLPAAQKTHFFPHIAIAQQLVYWHIRIATAGRGQSWTARYRRPP